jgi:protein-disulfide isomerase
MDKRFLIVMGVLITAFVGIFIYSGASNNENNTIGQPSNHVKGGNSKNVEILAFEDFQCPACAQFEPIVSEVFNKYKNEIQFRFRHFPIDSIHPNARAASRTAEAAGSQGKFFEMYDILFARQQQWASSDNAKTTFESYAKELNLDIDKFNQDFESEATNSTINADKQLGNDNGVEGTPTFYLNGQKLDSNEIQTVEGFSKKIEEAIAKSTNQ